MRVAAAGALIAYLFGIAPVLAAEEIRLPATFKKVWIRGEKAGGWGGGRGSGELSVTARALEFNSKKIKKSRVLPLDSIVAVSFGRMRGDVDTSWVVVRYRDEGQERIIGLRDGTKLGYGIATRSIHEVVREALRQAGAAQYDVGPGLQTYDELDRHFTLAYPEGWSSYHRVIVDAGDNRILGRLTFSVAEVPEGRAAASPEAQEEVERTLSRIDRGEIAAFEVLREESGDGMSCQGFSKHGLRRLQERFAFRDAVPVSFGGCRGLRVTTAGPDLRVDRGFVAHDGILYVLSHRTAADDPQRGAEEFAEALRTLRFSDAR